MLNNYCAHFVKHAVGPAHTLYIISIHVTDFLHANNKLSLKTRAHYNVVRYQLLEHSDVYTGTLVFKCLPCRKHS